MSAHPDFVAGWRCRLMPCRSPTSTDAIALLAKRQYEITPAGRVVATEAQPAIRGEAEFDGEDHPVRSLRRDTEMFPAKIRTDVVIHGHAHTGRIGICVGASRRDIRVFGDRWVACRRDGTLEFSVPRPFERIELSWRRCYGGIDLGVAHPRPQTFVQALEVLSPESHPGAYPRNPAGTGYAVQSNPDFLNGLPLPNFEDPRNLLTPENLVVAAEHWSTRPQPSGLGWVAPGWYPRTSFAGFPPARDPYDDDPELFEVREGWVPLRRGNRVDSLARGPDIDWKFCNGAAPGMRFPQLQGNERVVLEGLSPEGRAEFALPGEAPRSTIHMLGKRLEAMTELLTVEIDMDARTLTMMWVTRADVDRTLPLRLPRPSDASFDALEGIEGRIEGVEVPHEVVDLRNP